MVERDDQLEGPYGQQPFNPPLRRIVARPTWNTGSWTEQTAPSGRSPGLDFLFFERVVFPGIGRAQLQYVSGDYALLAKDGTTVSVPDLEGYEIRIQMAPAVREEGAVKEWRTVWWGAVEYQTDEIMPASDHTDNERTRRIYHCVDGLGRLRRRPFYRHAWYYEGRGAISNGHPGYNTDGRTHRVLGNKSSDPFAITSDFAAHTHYGAGDEWTDVEVIKNILNVSARDDDPDWFVSDLTATADESAFSSVNAWPVIEGASAYDVLAQVADRRRGRGLMILDWEDDIAEPTGPLKPKVVLKPQQKDDITVTRPSDNSTYDIAGSDTAGTSKTLTLQGDHRVMGLADINTRAKIADYVEVVGERIIVLVMLSYTDGTLDPRWDFKAATAFGKETSTTSKSSEYYHVYRSHGLPGGFIFEVADGIGGSATRCDYRLDDDGSINVPTATGDPDDADTSPLLARFALTVPIFPGAAENDSDTRPSLPRRPVPGIAYIVRNGELVELNKIVPGLGDPKVTPTEITIGALSDKHRGRRKFHPDGATPYTDLAVTVAIELPYRIRAAYSASSGTTDGADADKSKRKTIRLPDHHLWLAHEQASFPGQTFSSQPTILRDDRDKIIQQAALAFEWYGKTHRPFKVKIAACGFINDAGEDPGVGNEIDVQGGYAGGPSLGDVVTTAGANGQTYTINAPVSGMVYRVNADKHHFTEYVIDWQDLDFRRV